MVFTTHVTKQKNFSILFEIWTIFQIYARLHEFQINSRTKNDNHSNDLNSTTSKIKETYHTQQSHNKKSTIHSPADHLIITQFRIPNSKPIAERP